MGHAAPDGIGQKGSWLTVSDEHSLEVRLSREEGEPVTFRAIEEA
jgi:hypothetical protein